MPHLLAHVVYSCHLLMERSLKACLHGLHEPDWMCIGCASVSAFTRICIKSNWIHLQRWFGCTFKHNCISICDSCEGTPTIKSLVCLLVGLWRVLYCTFVICSCSDIGEGGSFLMAKKSGTAWLKNNYDGSIALQCLILMYNHSCLQCKWDKPQNSPPASSW